MLPKSEGEPDTDVYDTLPSDDEPLSPGLEHATVSIVSGQDAGRVVPLDDDPLVIGRGPEADLRIEDPGVSRIHARVVRSDQGSFTLEDLGSTNGTFIRTRRVTVAPLSPGDRVQLGPSALLRFAVTDPIDEDLQADLYRSRIRDPLTQAYNRRHLAERLTVEVAHARRTGSPLSVLMFDLDHFKRFNDDYGHFVGDRILCCAAAQVTNVLRAGDLLARFGGDEFVVLSRDTDGPRALALAERLRGAIGSMHMAAGGRAVTITATLGVASLADLAPDDRPEELLELVDRRLYAAKRQGRNRVRASDD